MEERITFSSGGKDLEGLILKTESDQAAVVTHPHPLYGGDMHNPVVAAIAGAYQGKGYTTLRFNFRGTGYSQGRHDQGRGERNDVIAAIDYLKRMGVKRVDLAGYSFGAWVNAHLKCAESGVERMVMVSPPIGFIEFNEVGTIGCLELVVAGSRDDIAPPDMLKRLITHWNPSARLEIVPGADHFFLGCYEALIARLTEVIKAMAAEDRGARAP